MTTTTTASWTQTATTTVKMYLKKRRFFAGVNQWASGGGPQLKELPSVPKPNNGWEEPSPPVQRRNMPNYDDGTSLWGSQQHARPAMQG
ncbi:unnamed protein product [Nesidiocoris tenuis]|uniref:Uncharacterized protein n=1 Tax=Nesidiocoris tenuis TaxID=355587 RepID=A0A6H5G7Y4_9HEMI|nr:unnamed protein product [Nesidiocoris tenuis]